MSWIRLSSLLVATLLCTLSGSCHVAAAWQLASNNVPTPTSVGCDEIGHYSEERNEVDEAFRETLVERFAGIGTNGDSGSTQRIVELMPFLNPDELGELASTIDEHVQALESISPPEIVRFYHLQVINVFRLTSNLAREASESGLVAASDVYIAPLTKTLNDAAEYAESATQICPAFSDLSSLDLSSTETDENEAAVPTPWSVAGQAQLKNVHDAIAAQGADVEYGRRTVRIEGITPVGQELTVEGVPVYVFIYESPDARSEQTAILSVDSIVLKTPSGANAATGELAISEGSNILTVSDGASQEVQLMIDAGIASLP